MSDADTLTRLAAFAKLAEFPTTRRSKPSSPPSSAIPPIKKTNGSARPPASSAKSTAPPSIATNLLPQSRLRKTIGANGLPEGWTRRDYGNREPTKPPSGPS